MGNLSCCGCMHAPLNIGGRRTPQSLEIVTGLILCGCCISNHCYCEFRYTTTMMSREHYLNYLKDFINLSLSFCVCVCTRVRAYVCKCRCWCMYVYVHVEVSRQPGYSFPGAIYHFCAYMRCVWYVCLLVCYIHVCLWVSVHPHLYF